MHLFISDINKWPLEMLEKRMLDAVLLKLYYVYSTGFFLIRIILLEQRGSYLAKN